MKLVLSACNDTTLQLALDNDVKLLPLTEAHRNLLQSCIQRYQAVLHRPDNQPLLLELGAQLAQLLQQQADLMGKWLNQIGVRPLEIETTLQLNALERLLLELPWEILTHAGQFLAADAILYEVTRRVGKANPAAAPPRYKDLTLAFMAADPDFSGGLNYEAEERAILQATRKATNLNLWVEESGNLETLTQRIIEAQPCDMVHISCHGGYDPQQGFVLQLEDDHYHPHLVTALDFQALARHVSCLFLSACHSAEMREAPALALQLVKMGMANVVGWNGSVADDNASAFAAAVYQALSQQASIPTACAIARQKLLQQHATTHPYPHWHLGRVYLAPTGGLPLLDNTQQPRPKRRGKAIHELLDKRKKAIPVASKLTFVGRRKQTKQALQVFASCQAAGVLLTGIGGTGKSSLAARIVQRLEPHYKAVVIYEDYSEIAILSALKSFITNVNDFSRYLSDIQQRPDLFSEHLIEILEKHVADQPIIVVVDDLEQHALDSLSPQAVTEKVTVKAIYQNALASLITAFADADTSSRLLFTSRYPFTVLDAYGEDKASELQEIAVPDMNAVEQEKHWLALLQTGEVKGVRDPERDQTFLTQIWAICRGNSGLQDVLYQPLLKGEYTVLQKALTQLHHYYATQKPPSSTETNDKVDKYLQRMALGTYYHALTDTERQCLRVLSLFDFAIPEQLLLQAGESLGINNAQAALQRLDNFGLLTHWQEDGLEGHITCYGLARKIVEPLTAEDRHFIASLCAPVLWQRWFADFLQTYHIDTTASLHEQMRFIWQNHFPKNYQGELPLQTTQEQTRIAHLHRLCIHNSLTDWAALGFSATDFVDLLELSLSLHTFEKLRVSTHTLHGLSDFQLRDIWKALNTERKEFTKLISTDKNMITAIMVQRFSGNPSLLTKAYQLYFGVISQQEQRELATIQIRNAEDLHLAAIQFAKTKPQQVTAYIDYADFLNNQKQDYAQAESYYQRAIDADPNNVRCLGNYAVFLSNQKQDYAQAESYYQRAIEADPNNAPCLGNYANLLANQKQDYVQAERYYQRAIEADPNDARYLGNYANLLANQKQDYAQAERYYQRAIEADPNNAINLGNYANVLYEQKQDYAQAEHYCQRSIEADPKNANALGNYAIFLEEQKQDYAQAESYYQRAIEADPKHANSLGNYANLLANQKQDYAQAESYYQRAIEADPNDANRLGNYAKLLFATNQSTKAQQYLAQAEKLNNSRLDLQLELAFYRYAHCQPHDLHALKQQLVAGSRSLGWDLTANVQRASADQHPAPTLLAAIAHVISGTQDIATLEQFPEWRATP